MVRQQDYDDLNNDDNFPMVYPSLNLFAGLNYTYRSALLPIKLSYLRVVAHHCSQQINKIKIHMYQSITNACSQ